MSSTSISMHGAVSIQTQCVRDGVLHWRRIIIMDDKGDETTIIVHPRGTRQAPDIEFLDDRAAGEPA